MAVVRFRNHLWQKALDLIQTKSSMDKGKAFYDIKQINIILTTASEGWGYDQMTAIQLDERLRREYHQAINEMDLIPRPNTLVSRRVDAVVSDPIIDRLKTDRCGILYDVLKKEGIVHGLEEFIEYVE